MAFPQPVSEDVQCPLEVLPRPRQVADVPQHAAQVVDSDRDCGVVQPVGRLIDGQRPLKMLHRLRQVTRILKDAA